MKQCTKCKEWKDESEFNKNKNMKDGLNPWCKQCRHDYNMEHKAEISAKNKRYNLENKDKRKAYYESHKEEISEYNKRWNAENKDKIRGYNQRRLEKGEKMRGEFKKPCVKCGESRPYVIDFHHVDPSKKSFVLSSADHHSYNEVAEEVKKCICLCKNCHTEFHYLYGKQPENPMEALREYLGDTYE